MYRSDVRHTLTGGGGDGGNKDKVQHEKVV